MPIARKTDIPEDFLKQMKSNMTMQSNPIPEPALSQDKLTPAGLSKTAESLLPSAPLQTAAEKKEKYADVMNIRLSKGRRNEIKTFCTSCGITITQYIETSFEFLAKEVADGNLVISKGGITKISK
ncbi:MAG: hypothetical protein K5873_01360 [Treponema sp.]|nr:hypothetical protein [Treponema sp.]